MTRAATVRALAREAKTQQRVKERVAVWWHATRCPNCMAKQALLSAMQQVAQGATFPATSTTPTAH